MEPSLEISAEFHGALSRLDYRTLSNSAGGAKGDLERYLVIRAAIVLGDYQLAERRLAEWYKIFETPAYPAFLDLQLRLYRRKELSEVAVALSGLTRLPSIEYVRGEYHFVLGYLYQLLSEFKQGSRHHRLARDAYSAAGLPACAAIAAFNLCLGSNYLNARALLLEQTADLEALVAQSGTPSLRALSAQWSAYQAIEREDFGAAENGLRELLVISLAENRRREVGAAGWLLAYVYSRMGREQALEDLYTLLAQHELTSEHRHALQEIARLARAGLLTADEARVTRRRWQRLHIDPILTFFLTDLLVEKLLQSQAYDAALVFAHRARLAMAREQQALSLVDFRYSEARALAHRGEAARALRLLAAYRSDAEERAATVRVEKAVRLAEQLAEDRSMVGSVIRIRPSTREISVGERTFQLDHQPKLFQMLLALGEEKKPVTASRLFLRVYGLEYHPLRHERRLNSMLERARRLLGGTDTIRRAEGVIGWAPELSVIVDSRPGGELLLQWRRQQILRYAREAARPLTISDLEHRFSVTRRTLQLDLEHLLRAGRLRTNGGTRGRKYFLEDSHETALSFAARSK